MQLPGQVFQLHADQLARRARQQGMDGGSQLGRHGGSRMRVQRHALRQQAGRIQRGQQLGAALRARDQRLHMGVALGEPAQALVDGDVVGSPEAGQRGQVVRGDHGQRLAQPLPGRAEGAVFQALEDQRRYESRSCCAMASRMAGATLPRSSPITMHR